jgi:hypothetical protein
MAVGKFKLVDGEELRLVRCTKDTGVVIEAGDLVALSSGLVIKATETSTAVGWCPNGAASADTVAEVTVGNDFTLKTTGNAVFAAAYKGGEYDIDVTTQYINYSGTTYKVLKVAIDEKAGTVGTAAGVTVRINKPLF